MDRRHCARCGVPTYGYICGACASEMPPILQRDDLIGVSRARMRWVRAGIPGERR